MTNVLILTCARARLEDPWQYIRQLVPQIEFEKAPVQCGIVCDGLYDGPRPEGWTVHEFDRSSSPMGAIKGNKLPFWRLLELGAELGGDLVALEDDILLSRNAIRRMAAFLVPADLAWVQFFNAHIFNGCGINMFPGIWRPPPGSSLCLQATKFPLWALRKIVAWQTDPRWVAYQASDEALAFCARALDLAYGTHCPDLCQHIGEESEANPGSKLEHQWRHSNCWPGTAFDSLSLFSRDDLFR
jgi:hypothetical protein